MPHILVIDDEPVYHKMIARAIEPLGYKLTTEVSGFGGLGAAEILHPDLIITDVMMPDLTGYEVTRRLRRLPEFANTPILILTSQAEIHDKLKSFEAGADDHMTKPFEPAELVARVGALLRRAEATRPIQQPETRLKQEQARMIAVHNLRGGAGSSTLAVNLGIGLQGLWQGSTLLLDLVLIAGQVALMLNLPLRRTWADLTNLKPHEIDPEVFLSICSKHESGLEFIAAPTFPSEAEKLTTNLFNAAMDVARSRYDYIVADLPHDFSEISLRALDQADVILMVLAPEMSSIRAAAAALDTYSVLNYDLEKIKLVLNATFPRSGITKEKIEKALGRSITLSLPYTPDMFVDAINFGRPPVFAQPDAPASALIEDFAFFLSKNGHKAIRPAVPSPAWKRVYKRFSNRRK